MKLQHLLETDDTLKLRVDNPGGSWLAGKRDYNHEAKPNEFGGPTRLGPVTGYWNRAVLLPVALLATAIKGLNGEQVEIHAN